MNKKIQNSKNNIPAEIVLMLPFFDTIQNGVVIADANSKILYTNPAYTKITEYPGEYALGLKAGFNRSGYHNEHFYKKMWDCLLKEGFWQGEIWNRSKSGRVYPSLVTINAIVSNNGKDKNYISIFSDITSLYSNKEKKINLAFNDFLTNLPNRLAINYHFSNAVRQNIRNNYKLKKDATNKQKIAILFFDIDKFKLVNDTYGHIIGDKLLQEIANRLIKVFRATDIIARFGGDEFIAIIQEIKNDSEIITVCNRILGIFEKPFLINDIEINSNTSIGVSTYPSDAKALENLIKMSDKAMYFSKKNDIKYVFYKDLKQKL